jgi:hypothetical protein
MYRQNIKLIAVHLTLALITISAIAAVTAVSAQPNTSLKSQKPKTYDADIRTKRALRGGIAIILRS